MRGKKMYTEKDLNEDFDYLARKCSNFKNTLLALSLDEKEFNDCSEINFKYYNELLDCFARLTDKYKPYFPDLEAYESYHLCDSELYQTYTLLSL